MNSVDALRATVVAHEKVQGLSHQRHQTCESRTMFAILARSAGVSIKELQDALGLSRTGVIKVLAGHKKEVTSQPPTSVIY